MGDDNKDIDIAKPVNKYIKECEKKKIPYGIIFVKPGKGAGGIFPQKKNDQNIEIVDNLFYMYLDLVMDLIPNHALQFQRYINKRFQEYELEHPYKFLDAPPQNSNDPFDNYTDSNTDFEE